MKHPLLGTRRNETLRRAVRLEWITIVALLSVVVVMYFAMGSSQAMKTAWVEDVLSLTPPIVFLLALRFEGRAPSADFPYGLLGFGTIAFVCASLALFGMGTWMLIEALLALFSDPHPTLGSAQLFGRLVWIGWPMLAALAYSVAVPMLLGALKLPLAAELHDKTLHADADMNRADWLTGIATAAGVLGVGSGWWWADGAAAATISIAIVRDGAKNLAGAARQILGAAPTDVEGKRLDLELRIQSELEALDFVRSARVRLREEGRFLSGEVFVQVIPDSRTAEVERELQTLLEGGDWRVVNLAVSCAEIDDFWSRKVALADGGNGALKA